VSRENAPMLKGLQRRDQGHGRVRRSKLTSLLAGARAIFVPVGDPDGAKARAAGEHGRVTAPLSAEQRLGNYARQDDGSVRITPARRRRIVKNLRRAGETGAASAWSGWDRSAGQRRREAKAGGRGASASRAILDEVAR
jgi:hypothetical protein